MTLFVVEEALANHLKTIKAGNAAIGLWVRCGAWCMGSLTDGFVPFEVVRQFGTPGQAKALVDAGLWEKGDDGYQFHDWLKYQRTRIRIAADKELGRERQRRHREKRQKKDGDM